MTTPARRPRLTNAQLGLIAVVVLAIFVYLAFSRAIPFGGGQYEITATFESSATLRGNSPVRIAGVNVGTVTGLERDGNNAKVTFTVSDEGRPIREDATVKIRPRLFLEGNFFLDLRPGSPSADELSDGGSIPITNTSVAVQFDEVLTALQQPQRRSLQDLLDGFGDGLNRTPSPAEDRDQDPDVRGKSAAEAINASFDFGKRAGKGSAQVTQALRGTRPDDLSRLIEGQRRVFRALARSQSQLRGLVSNLNVTAGALAAESGNLSETVAELAPTLEEAEPSLVALNETFPPLREFAKAAEPGVAELPATIDVATPWLRQARPLLRDSELGGIARFLRIATPPLASSTRDLGGLFGQLGDTGRCASTVLVPTGDVIFNRADDPFKTGVENYKEFFYGLVQQAGESQNFDGNGQAIRVQVGGGSVRASAPNPSGGFQNDELFTNTIEPPVGTQPVIASTQPPIREDVKCHTNDIPNLNGPAAAVGDPSPAVSTP